VTVQHFISLVPLVWLVFALVKLKWKAHWAILSALAVAVVLALSLWHFPAGQAVTSALEGAVSAIWPIFLIILAAMLVYDLSVRTGGMDAIKNMLAGVSNDKRILALIIIWGFGGFMEGMAGFGTAVAIPAAMMIALGVNPVVAAIAAMVSNALPTPFGAVGIPTTTLAQITRMDLLRITFGSAFVMAPITFLVPFIIVYIIGGGFKGLRGMWIPCLIASISLLVPQLLMAATVGPELAITVPAVISMAALIAYVRLRKPYVPAEYSLAAVPEVVAAPVSEADTGLAQEFSLVPGEGSNVIGENGVIIATQGDLSAAGESSAEADIAELEKPLMPIGLATLPFILVLVLLLLTSKVVAPINSFLARFSHAFQISTAPGAAPINFAWLNTPGLWIFIAAIITALAQHITPKVFFNQFGITLRRMLPTLYAIMGVLALAKVMTYSGMIADMADLFVTGTGRFYPFISPIIGALGAFVTGSGTNTQVLMGPLQTEAAQSLNISPYWLGAANQMGAGLGKVLSPQCIAVVIGATAMQGRESELLGRGLKWIGLMLLLAILIIGFASGIFMPIISRIHVPGA